MEEETSEGTWAETKEEEESTHPMRSSNTASESSTDSEERRHRREHGIGRIVHLSDILASMPDTATSPMPTTSSAIEEEVTLPDRSPETAKTSDDEFESFDKLTGCFFVKIYVLVVFTAWVGLAAYTNYRRAVPWIVVNCIVLVYFIGNTLWRLKLKKKWKAYIERHEPQQQVLESLREYLIVWFSVCIRVLIIPLWIWIVSDAWTSPIRLRSIGAVVGYVVLAVVCSANPARIKWRPVIGAFTVQLSVGIVLLRWNKGREKLVMVANQVVRFLDYTANGTAVVYEFIAFPPQICGMGFVFLFTAMQIIIYFGGIVSLLYYYGIIQAVLAKFAIVMQYTLGTTVIESLNAVACIFLGQTESAVLIGPAFETMTSSEITTVMCSGFACIAGALFSAYISFGACPEYLLSATVMSASVSLGIAKILYPEVQVSSQKSVKDMQLAKHEYHSCFDAISKGAIAASKVVGAIGMSLVVYLSVLNLINHSVIWITSRLGYDNVSFNDLVGYTFYPLALMMGASDATDPRVNRDETLKVAELMGLKTTVNEFVAYKRLADMITAGTLKGARAQMIATYALCGFSNISSIGAVLGIMYAMCPQRMHVFSKLAIRGLLGGCISCFLTASVAGILVQNPTSCPPMVFDTCLNMTVLQRHLNRTYGLPVI